MTQKEIKNTFATDITEASTDLCNELRKAKDYRTIGMSYGTYGMNGGLFLANGELYKITCRSTNLWIMA